MVNAIAPAAVPTNTRALFVFIAFSPELFF